MDLCAILNNWPDLFPVNGKYQSCGGNGRNHWFWREQAAPNHRSRLYWVI